MIASRLVTKKQSIEQELRLSGIHRDPARKCYLEARLVQMNRDIAALGFTKDEIDRNDVNADADEKTVGGKQYFVPPPSWWQNDNK